MRKIVFVAPASGKLNLAGDLRVLAEGHELKIIDGLVDRSGLTARLRSPDVVDAQVLYLASDANNGLFELTDGPLETDELLAMMRWFSGLQLIVINACNSLSMATAVHNRYHVPTVAHEAKIGDIEAIRFAEALFRNLLAGADLQDAFDGAVRTLMRLYPAYANTPRLINGDMATPSQINEILSSLAILTTRVERLEVQMAGAMPLPTTWQTWAQMALSLLASMMLAWLLLRSM